MMRKIFFCSEFPVTPEKWWRKKGRQLRSFLAFKQTQKLELFKKKQAKTWPKPATFEMKINLCHQ